MNPETTAERGKGDSESSSFIDDANARWQQTAVAAFYRAEARGFAPGGELDDWLAAERELYPPTPEPQGPFLAVEPITQPRGPQAKRSVGKGSGRSRKSESNTAGGNIGGMA